MTTKTNSNPTADANRQAVAYRQAKPNSASQSQAPQTEPDSPAYRQAESSSASAAHLEPTETIDIQLDASRPWPHWGQAKPPVTKAGQEALEALLGRLGLTLTAENEQQEIMFDEWLDAAQGGYEATDHYPYWRWLESSVEAQPTDGATLSEQLGQPGWEPPTWLTALGGATVTVTLTVERKGGQ